MILLNDFFTISAWNASEGNIEAVIEINKGHRIFDGHFLDQPVVPGVCMMQLVKEMIEQQLQRETQLAEAAEMKFLAVIDPTRNNIISVSVKHITEEGKIRVVASLFKDDTIHFRMKAAFV